MWFIVSKITLLQALLRRRESWSICPLRASFPDSHALRLGVGRGLATNLPFSTPTHPHYWSQSVQQLLNSFPTDHQHFSQIKGIHNSHFFSCWGNHVKNWCNEQSFKMGLLVLDGNMKLWQENKIGLLPHPSMLLCCVAASPDSISGWIEEIMIQVSDLRCNQRLFLLFNSFHIETKKTDSLFCHRKV